MRLPELVGGGRCTIRRLDESSVEAFADFLLGLRTRHWSLTSSAHQRRPLDIPMPNIADLLALEADETRIGTFLLRRGEAILGSLCLDYSKDWTSVVFSNAEADPTIQRRGIFAICLARPCFLAAMDLGVSTFTMTTWAFNRKAFPLYAKAGFRIVPNTSVSLVSFLPMLFRCYGHLFANDLKRFIGTHVPAATRGGFLESGEPCDVYPYSWTSGLDCDVQVERTSGAVHIVDHSRSQTFCHEEVQI
jgi:hypothetical protein